MFLDKVQAIVDNLQRNEPQEVHFEHTHVLNVMAVILGGADIQAGVLIL